MKVRGASQNHPRYGREVNDDVDDRQTDPGLWMEISSRFSFTIDAAAAPHNAMLPRYWTRTDDALKQSWRDERVWVNPPYSLLDPWVEKAWAEYREGCPLIVMLIPATRTEQKFWQRHVEPFRDQPGSPLSTKFLPGRPRFANARGEKIPPPFGCCLLIWGHEGTHPQ